MKKIIILSLIILFLSKTQNIFAESDTFTVDNIIVNGKIADNNYRQKYFEIALRKGFNTLTENILKKEDQKILASTNLETIKSLVENYRILKEEISESGNEYLVEMEVKFSRYSINDFFFKKNISYSEVTKLNILVYPIFISNSEAQFFSKNKFLREWNDNQDIKNIEFILPVENVEDIDFVKNNLDNLEEINLDTLVENYEVKNNSILILRHNKKKIDAFLKTNFKGTRKAKKFAFNIDNLEKQDSRYEIIKSLKFSINDFWKEQNLIDISVPSYLTVHAKIKNSKTLSTILNKLNNITIIDSYKVEELQTKKVKIKIKYFGKIKNLQESFVANGFDFQVLHNEWSLILNS